MAETRMTPGGVAPLLHPLEDVDNIRRLLKKGERVTAGGDMPTMHLPYHVDSYNVEGKEVECLVVAIPLNQSFGDLRIKPRRYDERQGKMLSPTLGITVSATCGAEAPPVFKFKDVDGGTIRLAAKKGLTLNLGLVDIAYVLTLANPGELNGVTALAESA